MVLRRWIYACRALLRRTFDARRADEELKEELQSHIAQETAARQARGVSASEARRQALAAFGSVESVRESVREAHPVVAAGQLLQDIRFGFRMLRRNPGFAVASVVTLALGIGSATTIFTVVDAVLLQPPPFSEPDGIVTVWQTDPESSNQPAAVAPANFLDWRAQATSFDRLASMDPTAVDFTGGDEPEVFLASYVSEGFFEALGVTAAHGRTFLPDEFEAGNRPVAVLTDALWRRRFGADPDVVGRALRLDEQLITVVGVLPPSFQLGLADREREVFLPKVFAEYEFFLRASAWWHVIGRLRPGVSVGEAQAEMSAIAGRLADDYPRTNTDVGARVIPLHVRQVATVQPALLLLVGAVSFFLLIACVNTANLMLTQHGRREREFAIRTAVGGGGTRLARQLLTESLLVAGLGAVGGVALAAAALDLVVAFSPAGVPRLQDLAIDARVVGFAALVVIVTAVGFGAATTARAIRGRVRAISQGQRTGPTPGQRRLRSGLVAAEIAFTLLLLVGAGLLVRSFARLVDVDLGFAAENTVALQVVAWERHDNGAARVNFFRQSIQAIRALPGVEAAGAASSFPLALGDFTMERPLTVLNNPAPAPGEQPSSAVSIAMPGYLETMRIPLRRGRWFDDRDAAGQPPVAVINEVLARRHWPDREPLAERVSIQYGEEAYDVEVVGVVGAVRPRGFDSRPRPELFLPHAQVPHGEMTYLVRRAGDSPAAIPAIQRAIWSVDPLQPFYSVATVEQLLRNTTSTRRFASGLLVLFALLALLLAAVGVFGVIREVAGQRTREIGLRTALGAQARDVVNMVVAGAVTPAMTGVAAGLVAALVLSRSISSLLYEVEPTDLTTLSAVSALLLAVVAVAAYLPARRAARVDAVRALRTE